MSKRRQGKNPPGPPVLVLASASPRRRELLRLLGVPFLAREARGVDEAAASGPAADVACRLAVEKAEAVLAEARAPLVPGRRLPDFLVLGADTLVALGEGEAEEVFGKPRDEEHAREMLARLSGRAHRVVTGMAVARPGAPTRVEVETSTVVFRRLSSSAIARYVATGEPLGKAGAYAIQGAGRELVEGFRGCYYNIVGLPLRRAAALLAELVPPVACDCGRHALQRGAPGCGGNRRRQPQRRVRPPRSPHGDGE